MTGLKPALEAGPFLGAEVVHKDFFSDHHRNDSDATQRSA